MSLDALGCGVFLLCVLWDLVALLCPKIVSKGSNSDFINGIMRGSVSLDLLKLMYVQYGV